MLCFYGNIRGRNFFYGLSILTEGVLVTQLSSDAECMSYHKLLFHERYVTGQDFEKSDINACTSPTSLSIGFIFLFEIQ